MVLTVVIMQNNLFRLDWAILSGVKGDKNTSNKAWEPKEKKYVK